MEEKSNLEGAWSLAAPGIVMFPFVLCVTLSFAYGSESHPALKPLAECFLRGGKHLISERRGPVDGAGI